MASATPGSSPKKVNYLNNKDVLKEIHRSKMTYSWAENKNLDIPDIYVDDLSQIAGSVQKAKEVKAARLSLAAYNAARAEGRQLKQKDVSIDHTDILDTDVVFRLTTYDHIPDEPGRKRNPKNKKEEKTKLNFPPFKQYALNADGTLREVARSHWKGDLETGEFSCTHGRITNTLGTMLIKLVEKYSHKGNWRGYSYVDEMRGQALVQLSQVALQFNEAKSDNPFSYFTNCCYRSFLGVLGLEKRNQGIRDDMLVDNGHLPSYSRQLDHEEDLRVARDLAEIDHDSN